MNLRTAPPRTRRADVRAGLVAVALFALAALVGGVLHLAGHSVHASAAPLFARWLPHVGPGTVPAVVLAGLVVLRGPALAAALSWHRLLAVAYAASLTWILALATVDGWQRGVAGRLTTRHEYLSEVGAVTDVAAMVRGYAGRILDFQPDAWTTHVAGHPPGALLVFVGLDRAGLGGGAWASLLCVLVAASVAVSVPVAVRAVSGEDAGRAVVPFVVLLPGAVWMGVSADGLFAGVVAAGVALLAIAATRRAPVAAVAAGLLLGYGVHLSYGLVLIAPVVLAVLVLTRGVAPLLWAAGGALAVAVAFTVAGFWWLDGYHLVVERYYQGIANDRPYAYWVWADLAAVVACAGPAAAAILRRAALTPRTALLPLAAAAAILAADLSGLSKAEVERIWLPFVVWLPAGAALLPAPDRRAWLAVQAGTALLVNHLLLTTW